MRTFIHVAAFALLCLGFATAASAQRDASRALRGFDPIGTITYSGRDTNVSLRIGSDAGRFERLRVRAQDADVFIRAATIVFGNGDRQRIRVRSRIRRGEFSPAADLDGNAPRFIRRIIFEIDPEIRRRQEARIQVFGAQPESIAPQIEFVVAGDRFADARDATVNIPVGPGVDPATHLRLAARQGVVRINSVTVYGRGFRERFNVGKTLRGGSRAALADVIEISRRPVDIERVLVSIEPSDDASAIYLQVETGRFEPRLDPTRFAPPPELDNRGRPVGQVLFGSTQMSARRGVDTIEVGRDRGVFRTIALRVLDRSIRLDRVTVVYGNGDRDVFAIGRRVSRNTVTPTFRLTGERFIDRIEIAATALGRGDRPGLVQVFGDYSERWLERRRRQARDSWVLLGAQRAQMFNADDDTFAVGRRLGRFQAIRVTARGNSVRIYGLTITYGDGSTEEVPLFTRLSSGETSEPIDLKGNRRSIRQIGIKYRSRFSLRGEGRVEVWGLRRRR